LGYLASGGLQAIAPERNVPYCSFYLWLERWCHFWQFTCRTYAL